MLDNLLVLSLLFTDQPSPTALRIYTMYRFSDAILIPSSVYFFHHVLKTPFGIPSTARKEETVVRYTRGEYFPRHCFTAAWNVCDFPLTKKTGHFNFLPASHLNTRKKKKKNTHHAITGQTDR